MESKNKVSKAKTNTSEDGYIGYCRAYHQQIPDRGYTSNDVRCTIMIVYMDQEIFDPRELLDDYLSILMHEMCHAVLEIYACDCVLKCQTKTEKLQGETGHARAWHHIMANIDDATKALMGQDFKLKSDREMHLSIEVHSVAHPPTVKEVSSWTRAVKNLVGITKYRILHIWGTSLRKVATSYQNLLDRINHGRLSYRRRQRQLRQH